MVPAKLLASGYVFTHPALDDALRAALQKDNN
jgi:NAD dependent epimerase/dehydratase family enzyme